MINVIILQDEEGGYYYVHRDTYDQALMLTEAYSDKTAISKMFDSITNMSVAEKAYNFLPKPINILAPFLCLVDGDLDIEKKEDIIGALHILTQTLNMRRIVTLPSQARNSLTFSLHIIEEYKSSWESFFVSFGQANVIANGAKTSTTVIENIPQREVVNSIITPVKEEIVKTIITPEVQKAVDAGENTITFMDDDEDDIDALMAKFEAETAAEREEEDKEVEEKKKESSVETKKATKDWGF